MSFLFGNRSSKTFKPKKNIPEGSKQHELMQHAAATLGSGFCRLFRLFGNRPAPNENQFSGNLRLAVMLPEGEDINE